MQLLELPLYFPTDLKVHLDLLPYLFVQPRAQGHHAAVLGGWSWNRVTWEVARQSLCDIQGGVWCTLVAPTGQRWWQMRRGHQSPAHINLSEEGGWPSLHPLPLTQENIVFSTSNILFISNVILLLLNSHLIHTCCIPFVPKSAWHYTINASASVKS